MYKLIIILLLCILIMPVVAQEEAPVIPVINHQVQINEQPTRGGTRINNFAATLAMENDILAIGAMYELFHDDAGAHRGAVYVYRLVNDQWFFETKLINPLADDSTFGLSIAVENGVLAVSSAGYRVHFYEHDALNGWTQTGLALDNDVSASDNFGYKIALANNTLVVSERIWATGFVHVYKKELGNWNLKQTLTGDPNPSGDASRFFGSALDISEDGNLIVVGEPEGWRVDNQNPLGAAYIYSFDGLWNFEKMLTESGAGAFGFSVDLIGDGNNMLLAVSDTGQYSEDPFMDISGSVYIYNRATGWSDLNQFAATSDITFDQFGATVQFVGQPENAALIVSALPYPLPEGQPAPARFYIFDVQTGSLIGEIISPSETDLDGDGVVDTDQFGRIISIDDVGENLKIAVGAPGGSSLGDAQVFIYSHNPAPQEMVNAGNFESSSRDVILNAWSRTPGAKLKCLDKGNGSPCAVKFVSGIASRVWQNVDLSQIGLFPGDAVLFQADAKVKGASSLKMKLKVVYGDGFKAVVTLRVNNTGGAYRRVMSAPAVFIANRPLAKIQIKVNHNHLGGAAFLDNVSLVRVAGSSAR
jgi:hypothetical protein